MAEKFFGGKVDALCNNAGIFHKTDWKKVLDINFMGVAYGTMLAIEKMGVSNGGSGGLIVQTGSMASFLAGFPTIEEGAYTAAKQGIHGYCRAMANEETYIKYTNSILEHLIWLYMKGKGSHGRSLSLVC